MTSISKLQQSHTQSRHDSLRSNVFGRIQISESRHQNPRPYLAVDTLQQGVALVLSAGHVWLEGRRLVLNRLDGGTELLRQVCLGGAVG